MINILYALILSGPDQRVRKKVGLHVSQENQCEREKERVACNQWDWERKKEEIKQEYIYFSHKKLEMGRKGKADAR